MDLGDLGADPTDNAVRSEPTANPGALFDEAQAARVAPVSADPASPVAPAVPAASAAAPEQAVSPVSPVTPVAPQMAPSAAAPEGPGVPEAAVPTSAEAAAPATPAPKPAEPDAQTSLLDSSEVAVAVASVPPAAAAKTSDLAGATSVATYGDRDLDDIVADLAKEGPDAAAGTVATEGAAEAGAADEVSATTGPTQGVPAPWWPFLAYAGVWALYAIGLALVMKPAAAGGSLFASPYYQMFLWGGLVLAIAGPLLVLLVWLIARRGYEKGRRGGLFSSALIKGAVALFVGVVLWWAAYYAAVWLAGSGR